MTNGFKGVSQKFQYEFQDQGLYFFFLKSFICTGSIELTLQSQIFIFLYIIYLKTKVRRKEPITRGRLEVNRNYKLRMGKRVGI